jgi:hypothetical protein
MHKSLRVYNDGSYVTELISPENLQEHIDYNIKNRFGCALIIDKVLHS